MTTEIQKKEDTGIEQYTLSEKDIKTLQEASIIPAGTPAEQVMLFAKVCQERQLSPFSKQIYIIGRNAKQKDGSYKTMYTHQTSIDGYRSIAEKTGAYGGSDDYIFDDGKTQFEMISEGKKKPMTATVTVYKIVKGIRCAFTATARWEEYYNQYNPLWGKMPFNQLGKCAESAALRKAFPGSLGGIHTDNEHFHDEIKDDQQAAANENGKAKPAAAKKKPSVVKTEKVETVEAEIVSEEKEAKPKQTVPTKVQKAKVEETKPSQEDLFNKYTLRVDDYLDHNLLKEEAGGIITNALTDGLSKENNKELQGYINDKYVQLKNATE